MSRPCFAWFLPCVYSAKNVDAGGSSSPAKNDSKAARFEKVLEESEQDLEEETQTKIVGHGSGDHNETMQAAGAQLAKNSVEPHSDATPWIVKEKPSDPTKPQDGRVVGLVGQVGSLHRQGEAGPQRNEAKGEGGSLFFEARSTPRWGTSSPVKAGTVPNSKESGALSQAAPDLAVQVASCAP